MAMAANKMNVMVVSIVLLLILLPVSVFAECTCDKESESEAGNNKSQALKYKLIAIASILVAGAAGVSVPLFGKAIESLRPGNDFFLIVKFFAAGVILATGFVHVLPDANESLDNPCLGEKSWGDFPLASLVAMLAALFVMIVETAVTSMFNKMHYQAGGKTADAGADEKGHEGHVHVHTHASHGHAHGPALSGSSGSQTLLRHRIISQVLEVGIVVHSVIIGISLGASMSPETIKPLVVALSFHQLFEGMGLGSCISEAQFRARTVATMSIFFSLTTPLGIAVGFGISSIYDENSRTSLIVQGVLNAASAGILIYMALVDLLAADIMNSRVQSSSKLQIVAYVFLLLGAGSMSLLAIWA